MEIVIRNSDRADKFAAIFQHIKLFTDHISLHCNKTHMKMQCMDNAHVAILELSLPSGWFDVYEISNVEDGDNTGIRIGFNATFLHRILSSRDKEQQIQLVHSSEDVDRLMIHLTKPEEVLAGQSDTASISAIKKEKKPAANNFDKHFELPLIDIEEETMQIPAIEYAAELAMQSSQFADIIAQLKMFGDTMDVQCSEERIALASTSQDQGKMFVEIGINDLAEFAIDEGADLALSFSLTYLKYFCAYSKIADLVSIKFGESYPMRISYSLGEEEDAVFAFHLAPKINDD
jgi:DNA polymerase III sliding clamp (beta) subunit (PCNA family)